MIEETDIYEVRRKGDKWHLWYPDEAYIETSFPVYDKEGKLKTIIRAHGGDTEKIKLTESNIDFDSSEEAMDYAAKVLGAETIKVVKSSKGRKPTRKA